MDNNGWGNHYAKILGGIAIGAAVGLGIALTRRKRTRWDHAKAIGKRVAGRSEDAAAEAARDIIERARIIRQEGRTVMENAGKLWAYGRKLSWAR